MIRSKDGNRDMRANNVLPWSRLLSSIDQNVAYEVARSHHRGSFLRSGAIDTRRFMPSSEECKAFTACDLHLNRGGDVNPLPNPSGCINGLSRRSPTSFRDNGRFDIQIIGNLLGESFACQNSQGFRPYPSGGQLYPVEVFLAILDDGQLERGFFHYLAASHALEAGITPTSDISEILFGPNQPWGIPSFVLVYVVNLPRTIIKYRHRGYRLALMEAGAMFHQASIVGGKLGLYDRVTNAFSDHWLTGELGLNASLFFPLAVQSFGRQDDLKNNDI